MKTITLKNGIIIRDNRDISCGIQIETPCTKYMSLQYSSEIGFYINMSGRWVTIDEVPYYLKELEIMQSAIIEANQIIK